MVLTIERRGRGVSEPLVIQFATLNYPRCKGTNKLVDNQKIKSN